MVSKLFQVSGLVEPPYFIDRDWVPDRIFGSEAEQEAQAAVCGDSF